MKDISTFVSKRSHEESLMDRFSKLVKKAKSKEEIRDLEMRLLRPKPIKQYSGPKVGRNSFKERCLLVVFPKKSVIERIGKYFRINTYIENNTYDIDFLIELLNQMDSGRIEWNMKKKKYYLRLRTGKKIRI
jgi:hypothetical protein